ncbi:MAG: hypothetical protein QM570_04185 [Planctomycetota bacterium]|nr:hypothetical protein [Planctomycetota bacterium]
MRDNRWRADWLLVVGFSLFLALLPGGCRTSRPMLTDGLPGEEYLVGGGVMINWQASAEGTAYLVEKSSGKIVETRSMKRGDIYDFSIGSASQASEFEKVFGVKLSEARLLLYFQPAPAGRSGL